MSDDVRTYGHIDVSGPPPPRVQGRSVLLSIDGVTAGLSPFEATRIAARLVRAADDAIPPRLPGRLRPEEFGLMVKFLRRYAETEMDQWETFSFGTSFGEICLTLTIAGTVVPEGFHSIDGFTAGVHGALDRPPVDGTGWSVDCGGALVEQVVIDHRIGLHVGDGTKVVLATPFRSMVDGTATEIDPEETSTIAPVLALRHRAVSAVHATAEGSLVVSFADGSRLEASADAVYEAWELIHAGGSIQIALPGGGVASFPGGDDPIVRRA